MKEKNNRLKNSTRKVACNEASRREQSSNGADVATFGWLRPERVKVLPKIVASSGGFARASYFHAKSVVAGVESRSYYGDKGRDMQVRANFPRRYCVPSVPFGIRGSRRSGFARCGEKIACSD